MPALIAWPLEVVPRTGFTDTDTTGRSAIGRVPSASFASTASSSEGMTLTACIKIASRPWDGSLIHVPIERYAGKESV